MNDEEAKAALMDFIDAVKRIANALEKIAETKSFYLEREKAKGEVK